MAVWAWPLCREGWMPHLFKNTDATIATTIPIGAFSSNNDINNNEIIFSYSRYQQVFISSI